MVLFNLAYKWKFQNVRVSTVSTIRLPTIRNYFPLPRHLSGFRWRESFKINKTKYTRSNLCSDFESSFPCPPWPPAPTFHQELLSFDLTFFTDQVSSFPLHSVLILFFLCVGSFVNLPNCTERQTLKNEENKSGPPQVLWPGELLSLPRCQFANLTLSHHLRTCFWWPRI